jgi:hypothetical protein
MGTHCDFSLFLPDIVNSPSWVDCSDILRVWLQACVYTLPGSSHQNEGLFDPESFLRPAPQGRRGGSPPQNTCRPAMYRFHFSITILIFSSDEYFFRV